MNLLLVIFCFAAIAITNVPVLVKNKRWRDLGVYSAFYLAVLTLAVLVALNVKVPSPIKAAEHFYRDVLHLSFKQ